LFLISQGHNVSGGIISGGIPDSTRCASNHFNHLSLRLDDSWRFACSGKEHPVPDPIELVSLNVQPVNDELPVELIFAWQRKDLDSEAVWPLPDLHGKYLGQRGGIQPGDVCVVIEDDFWSRKERLGKGKQRRERQRPEPSSEEAAVSSVHKTS